MATDIKHFLEKPELLLLREGALEWAPPMLATLYEKPFSKQGWIYEYKFDGLRALIYCQNGKIKILSRNRLDIGKYYPELIRAFKKNHSENFILDGEIVAYKKNVPNFSLLQQRMHAKRPKIKKIPVFFYVFDIIFYEKYFLEKLTLIKRKEILEKVFDFQAPVMSTEYFLGQGISLLHKACSEGWEGVIAKRACSTYVHKRSQDWVKFKCTKKQEFVIGGFTKPKGARKRFGALLLGYYKEKNLMFAGKVGTGFTQELLEQLYTKLVDLRASRSPFSETVLGRGITWIKPDLVAEIGFTEWTKDGKLRHPSFSGLRIDKSPKEVFKEIPKVDNGS